MTQLRPSHDWKWTEVRLGDLCYYAPHGSWYLVYQIDMADTKLIIKGWNLDMNLFDCLVRECWVNYANINPGWQIIRNGEWVKL